MQKLCVFIALFFFALTVNGESKPDFSEAKTILQEAIKNHIFPGCTVAVGTDKEILWSGAFGYQDYEHKVSVTRKTIYDLASLTKVTGTTSVYMRLVALGKIKASDPISKYLPKFIAAAPNPEEKATRQKITIEHLLTHTGGIVGWGPFYKNINTYPELLEAIFKTPLENAPGVRFRYSDLGMILLGEIAAQAGGKPLSDLEQELVFRPLKMKSTFRNPSQKLWSRIPPTEALPGTNIFVHGVVHDENARAGEGITGHAGLFSTAEDLSRLATELLHALEGKSHLIPKTVAEDFLHEHETIKNSGRGLGWGISDRVWLGKTNDIASHTGFTGTSIRMDLDQKIYIVLLTNRVHPTRENDKIGRVRSQLTDAVLRAWESYLK